MHRIVNVALSALGLAVAAVCSTASAGASTFTMEFDGTIVGGGGPLHGSVTMDVPAPLFVPGSESANVYFLSTASYSITFGSTTTSGNLGGVSALNKAIDNSSTLGMPYDSFSIDLFGNGVPQDQLHFLLSSGNTNTALPLLSLETVPTTLAAWIATYGAITASNFTAGGVLRFFNLTSYTVTSAVATTPIPSAVLLFGTALLGLGGFGARRRQKAAAA